MDLQFIFVLSQKWCSKMQQTVYDDNEKWVKENNKNYIAFIKNIVKVSIWRTYKK